LVGADAKEIFFTSGATESNNTVIKGITKFYKQRGRHVITTQTEHKCVLDSCRVLERDGSIDVTYLPVKPDGLVDIEVCCLLRLSVAGLFTRISTPHNGIPFYRYSKQQFVQTQCWHQ
jgi:cysteine sulfinate desulfinase/cysteine desulfurase-like protein